MDCGLTVTDVFIVGGGPAGLATAIAIRLKGMEVALADPAVPSIDKACGEGLMPNAVTSLRVLGVDLERGLAVPFRGIRFVHAGDSAVGAFHQGHGLGVRRTALHRALVDRAMEVGVKCLWRTPVTDIAAGQIWLGARRVRCRWIVAADGQDSRVRKWAGLDRAIPRGQRFGFRRHYRVGPWTDLVEVHWGDNCQVVVTPVGGDELCVAVTSRSRHMRLKDALTLFPEINRRLEGRRAITTELGSITALRVLPRVFQGRIALVGDASGTVDPLTGEGLGLAFRQARTLAAAIACGDLNQYQIAHRQMQRTPEMMSRLLLAVESGPVLRRWAIRALAKSPRLFDGLLAARIDFDSPFGDFRNFLRLTRHVVAGAG